jgi:zinc protease
MIRFQFVFILLLLNSISTHASEVIFETDDQLPLVTVAVVIPGGSSQDPDHKNGLTDLTARMMLRGTKNKTKRQIDLELDQMGGALSVTTQSEYSVFQGTVLSKNSARFIQLIEDILNAASFNESEFKRLKSEQLSNLKTALDDDSTLVGMRFSQNFFLGHPYSKNNAGRIRDITALQVQDLKEFYSKTFQKRNRLVVGLGDSNASTESQMTTLTEKSNLTPIQVGSFLQKPQTQTKLKVVIFDKPARTQSQIIIGQTGASIQSPQLDALMLANHVFGGDSFQSRLMKELRVKRGWTYGARSQFKLASQPHLWFLSFFPKSSDTAPAIAEAMNQVRLLKEKGLSAEEFEFAKKSLIASSGFLVNTAKKRLENRMLEVLYGLPKNYYQDYSKRLATLTLEQVNAALKSFLTPDQMMVGVVTTATSTKSAIASALNIPVTDVQVQSYLQE